MMDGSTNASTNTDGATRWEDDTATTAVGMDVHKKYITFVRHGRTYMNEYLGGADGGKRFGSPQFTDIFNDPVQYNKKYHDSPLSTYGRKQVEAMATSSLPLPFVQDCDLIVVSPLRRALQTYDIGIRPWIDKKHCNNCDKEDEVPVAVMALPYAAERLYLISDVGRPVAELKEEYPYIDFSTGFQENENVDVDEWWYRPDKYESNSNNNNHNHYIEWRPIGKGQRYACPGEPEDAFNKRMNELYTWLEKRPETNIVVVCHHGVIGWFLDMDFSNCQYMTVPFHQLQPKELSIIQQGSNIM